LRKTKILIWGTSGHALVVADIIRLCEEYEIAGFLDDNRNCHGADFLDTPILGGREQLKRLRKKNFTYLIVGVGDCRARLELADLALTKGFKLATAIHPKTTIANDVFIGRGTVIMAGSVVNPQARIAQNVIINTLASVGHECQLEKGVHVGPGVRLGGGVKIGKGSWIGIGAVAKDNIKIGANVTVGAGSVVIKDLPDNVIAYGVPARIQGTK
jgi:sugar O-acyltransferase (sialic acid O-acetyltransferase NeuD family)